jgi:hypothetical protein
MIEPTFDDIGRAVLYTGNRYPGGKVERGRITGLTALGVLVCYEGDRHAKSTMREDLEWDAFQAPSCREIDPAFASLEGEREAMEGLGGAALAMHQVAGTIDARFAAIEARLTALENRTIEGTVGGGGEWNPDTAPVHHVSEELREKLARDLGGNANEAVPGGARVGGVVSPTPRHPDLEQLPQNRDAEGGAVETGGEIPLSASGRKATERDDG